MKRRTRRKTTKLWAESAAFRFRTPRPSTLDRVHLADRTILMAGSRRSLPQLRECDSAGAVSPQVILEQLAGQQGATRTPVSRLPTTDAATTLEGEVPYPAWFRACRYTACLFLSKPDIGSREFKENLVRRALRRRVEREDTAGVGVGQGQNVLAGHLGRIHPAGPRRGHTAV